MKRIRNLFLTATLIFALGTTSFANGLSLNSVGTRALGMGGAFVGLANDATALYWNPAGLAKLQNSILVFGTDVMPNATYKMDAAGIDAATNSKHYISPNVFFNYNFGDLAVGIGLYVPAGLGTDWKSDDFGYPAGYDFMSKIAVFNISPGIAYKITDAFSVGLAINIYYGMFDLSQPILAGTSVMQFEETSSGTGFGATIGLKYDFSEMVSAGLSFRTKTTVSMSGTAKNPAFAGYGFETESDFDRDVTWPMWIAGGIAVHPSDKFTITFDAQYSQWSELDKLVATYKDANWEATMASTGGNTFEMKWNDATQIRLGLEYLVSPSLALRGGYYYDPAPAPDETVNVLFPSSTNHVATVGLGWMSGKLKIEGAFEYLFGAEREIEMVPENAMPGTHQMDVMAFSLGFSYGL